MIIFLGAMEENKCGCFLLKHIGHDNNIVLHDIVVLLTEVRAATGVRGERHLSDIVI